MSRKLGKDLCVGDSIDVWWIKGTDTIVEIVDHPGDKTYLDESTRIAIFAHNRAGMTIEGGRFFDVQ